MYLNLFLVLVILLSLFSPAGASIPLPPSRPDRNLSSDLKGIWKGNLTVGVPSESEAPNCKNNIGSPKKLTLKMCTETNLDDGIDTITGKANFKRRYKLLQRDASFKKIAKKNRFRTSTATNGSDNPGGEDATAAITWFQKNMNNDNSRHGNITMEIAETDSEGLDTNGDPLFLAGQLVVTLGNCISGILTRTGPNPLCP